MPAFVIVLIVYGVIAILTAISFFGFRAFSLALPTDGEL
jgi:hypothetical protein